MRAFKIACICIVVAACVARAKNTYSEFSLGLAVPLSSATLTPTGDKELRPGWDGAWTFFGFPFTKFENAVSGLGFGGKINFCRWVRDSTWKDLTFLGTQGIVRYYLPLKPKRFEFFGQVGGGMFIGEHGFSDHDTLDRNSFPMPEVIIKGAKNGGITFNIGMNWDVMEVTPGMTIVFTEEKPSAWFSISAAAKF